MKKWLILLLFACPLFASVDVYFSKRDPIDKKLIKQIDKEPESLQVAIYAFTNRNIASALQRAKERGVEVSIIADIFTKLCAAELLNSMKNQGIEVIYFNENKLPGNPLMHHKFVVFGKRAVWTGSYNFTYKATKTNCENALFIEDEAIAEQFSQEFSRVKTQLRNSFQ